MASTSSGVFNSAIQTGATISAPSSDAGQPERPFARGTRACAACRKAKIRCDGWEHPPCARCRHFRLDCVFEKPVKARDDREKVSNAHVESLIVSSARDLREEIDSSQTLLLQRMTELEHRFNSRFDDIVYRIDSLARLVHDLHGIKSSAHPHRQETSTPAPISSHPMSHASTSTPSGSWSGTAPATSAGSSQHMTSSTAASSVVGSPELARRPPLGPAVVAGPPNSRGGPTPSGMPMDAFMEPDQHAASTRSIQRPNQLSALRTSQVGSRV